MSKKHKHRQTPSRKPTSAKSRVVQKPTPIWVWLILAAAVIVGGIYWFSSPKSPRETEITIAQAREKIQHGAFILDVRSQTEYDSVHLEDSTLIPLAELKNRLDELPREREIVVVCRSGNRSKQALSILHDAGIIKAFSMAGGLNAWKQVGYPLAGVSP